VGAALSVLLLVTVDTEEDNWRPTRHGITTHNIGQLPLFARWLERLGIRATYFTAYQVARRPCAVEILREISAGGAAEIGAHLHPWNTPPYATPLVPRYTMMKNLPAELQLAKLRRITGTLEKALGRRPTAFRAGRFGIGPGAISALVACGYRVDSSVTPYVSWEFADDGPSFVEAPTHAYRVGEEGGITVPDPAGPLIEIPVTSGYAGVSARHWRTVHRVLQSPAARAVRLAGVACRLGIVKRTILSPEGESVRDLLALTRGALDGGARYVNLMLHSSTLLPGLTPWTATAEDVVRFYAKIEQYVDRLAAMTAVQSATVSEASAALDLVAPGEDGQDGLRDPVHVGLPKLLVNR
jgi:hypothetical protein